jgi:hypothetical protein
VSKSKHNRRPARPAHSRTLRFTVCDCCGMVSVSVREGARISRIELGLDELAFVTEGAFAIAEQFVGGCDG